MKKIKSLTGESNDKDNEKKENKENNEKKENWLRKWW